MENKMHVEKIEGAAVHRTDRRIHVIQGVAEQLSKQHTPLSDGPLPVAEYVILQSALPNTTIENIGIMLLDAEKDQVHCRFRRDFKTFAGDDADILKLLDNCITEYANERGAAALLDWMESTLSNAIRISSRKSVVITADGAALNALYAEHIRPVVLQFQTHLPQYTLEAAAGKFGKQMTVEPEGWVEIHSDVPLTEDMFVAHVKGPSMEPLIPDPSPCVFQSKFVGSPDGRVMLLEHNEKSIAHRYTVKLCRLSQIIDSQPNDNDEWQHHRVVLESMNPHYEPWEVGPSEVRAIGEFLFVVV